MSSYYLLDENKNAVPCSHQEYIIHLSERNKDPNIQVAYETIGEYEVSTVWVGIDHSYFSNGPPLLFETMVFKDDFNEIYCDRYPTWKEAEEGHKRAVEWVNNGCKGGD